MNDVPPPATDAADPSPASTPPPETDAAPSTRPPAAAASAAEVRLAPGAPPTPAAAVVRPPAAPPTLSGPLPRQLGRFPIVRSLRRERNSIVYLGVDPVLHRDVVIKAVQLPPPSDATAQHDAQLDPLEQAFVRQAQAAGKLAHPHIVTVYEAGRVHNLAYLAIERVNGRPLHELLASGWRPQLVHGASIAARIADAIEHAHLQGIAHGHLGPQHVLLQADGAPKVEGFGGWLDSGAGGEAALARTERLLPYFHSELSDEARAADVRAVAALLFMMVTGKAPGAQPAPAATLRAGLPAALAQLLDEALAAGTARRTAADLRDALTAFIWNERREHVAPATLGIPLAPPPPPPRMQAPAAPATVRMAAGAGPAPEPAPVEPASPALAQAPDARPAPPLPTAAQRPARPVLPAGLRDGWRRHRTPIAIGAAALLLLAGALLGRSSAPPPAPPAAVAPPPAPAPVGDGVVQLDIEPWGEVIVDGRPTGVSPPLQQLRLRAGRHNIEIRYGEKAAVAAQVEVDPARPQTIRHRFQ